MSPLVRVVRLRTLLGRAGAGLPGGLELDEQAWRRRHRVLVGLALTHVPLLSVLALLGGGARTGAVMVAALAVVALLATLEPLSRLSRSLLTATALVGCSSVLVHLTGGVTESHFHFFIVVALLPLYQAWPPLVAAVVLVVIEHGVVGVLAPQAVYGHPGAQQHPWRWAAVHGVAVLLVAAASVTAWAINERDHRAVRAQRDLARRQKEEALQHLALHDPLTGLPNRLLLEDRLSQALIAGARTGTGTAVLFLDLDGFKAVNDSRGHAAGDEVLRRTGAALAAQLRPGDSAARLGGDEFAVVCPGVSHLADADRAAQRLRDALRLVLAADGVDVSIGVAVSGPGRSPHQLLVAADHAMYADKRGRRVGPAHLPAPRPPGQPVER